MPLPVGLRLQVLKGNDALRPWAKAHSGSDASSLTMTMLVVGKNEGACGGQEWRCWQREGMVLLVAGQNYAGGKNCNAGSGEWCCSAAAGRRGGIA